MTWKAIGRSVRGISHVSSGKGCEDSIHYGQVQCGDQDVLICCLSDGAGSALHAEAAAAFTTSTAWEYLAAAVTQANPLTEELIYAMAETVYSGLEQLAAEHECALDEFSCTLLGCVINKGNAAFFQVGDGAIVRSDGQGYFTAVWWPHSGEYLNTTAFVTDDPNFGDLAVTIIDDTIEELALFSDGLQMLCLNTESKTVHQPFFNDLFRYLRMADSNERLDILNEKLAGFLDSQPVNDRTDDDKTLFLATRLHHDTNGTK